MHQAFNALLQLHESAVVSDADDPALHVGTDRVPVSGIQPRIGRELFEAQRNTLLLFIKLKHFYLNFVGDINQITRMGQAAPRHVRDVQ